MFPKGTIETLLQIKLDETDVTATNTARIRPADI